jgi:hypothetical protein
MRLARKSGRRHGLLRAFMNSPVKHVVIHQSGKVGSSTLLAALTAARPELTVVKPHFLSPYYTEYFRTIVSHPNCPAGLRNVLQQQLSLSGRARGLLQESPPEQCCILSGVRDPLSYAVSAFFQNVAFFLPDLGVDPACHETELARLNDRFHQLFAYCCGECPAEPVPLFAKWVLGGAGVCWYTDDYCATYGIDMPCWPRADADTISFRHAGRRHIIYRFEAFRACLNEILPEIGLPPVESLLSRNISANKPYARLYEAFKERFQPTSAMWNFYYESPFFRHFYQGATPAFPSPNRSLITGREPTRNFTMNRPEPPQVKGWRARPITSPPEDELQVARRDRQRAERRLREVVQKLERTEEQLRQTEQRLERAQLQLKQTRHTLDVAEGCLPLKQLLRQTETRLSRAEQRSDQAERRLELSERNRQEAEDRQIDQCLRNTRAEHAILNLQVVTEQLQSSTTYLWIKTSTARRTCSPRASVTSSWYSIDLSINAGSCSSSATK